MSAFFRGLASAQDRAFQSELQGRQRKAWADEDKLSADMKAANQAGAERLASFAPKPDPVGHYLKLGGTDSSMPDQTAIDQAPKAEPFRPTQQHLLAAAQARTDKLFELGRHEQAVQQWAKDEQMRGLMRRQAAERGVASYKASGDPTELLKGVYDTIDDGWDFKGVTPSKGLDGSVRYRVERVNPRTGAVEDHELAAGEIDGLIGFALDPVQAAQYALKEKLAQFEAGQKQATERVKGEEDRKTAGTKHSFSLAEHAAQNRYSLGQISARGAEERRTAAAAPYTLGEGQERFTPGKDGKPVSVAKGAPKASKPSDEVRDAENLLDTLAKAGIGGTQDMLTGRVSPDALTQQAAQRVNQYRKTSGMSFDEAVAKVRKEMAERGLLK